PADAESRAGGSDGTTGPGWRHSELVFSAKVIRLRHRRARHSEVSVAGCRTASRLALPSSGFGSLFEGGFAHGRARQADNPKGTAEDRQRDGPPEERAGPGTPRRRTARPAQGRQRNRPEGNPRTASGARRGDSGFAQGGRAVPGHHRAELGGDRARSSPSPSSPDPRSLDRG